MENKEKASSKDFSQSYQKALNNYINTIKYYTSNIQIIDGIEKIINEYKTSILSFKNKLIKIKTNLIQSIIEVERKSYNHSIYNKFLQSLDFIFNSQIEFITNVLNDIEKKVIFEHEVKNTNNTTFVNILQQNKNCIQNNQKIMEKLFVDYNDEYDKFINEFSFIEEDVQKYYTKLRKKIIEDKNNIKFNEFFFQAKNAQESFLQVHNKFQENNKKYFDFYSEKMKELENKLIQKGTNTENNINSFLLILLNNLNTLTKSLNDFNKEKTKEISELNKIDFNLFSEKNLSKINFNYENAKYKVKAIHYNLIEGYITPKSREAIKELTDELDIDTFVEDTALVLNEEDIFEVTKFFYGLFSYVDTSEFDLILEKKKLEVINLTNKLLQPGLIKKEQEEFKNLLPINDNEIQILKNYIIQDRIYQNSFLLRINNYRALGIYSMPQKEFDLISNLFLLILNFILKEKKDEDFPILKLIIILSQTFFVNKDNQKYYLNHKLKGHKLFDEIDFLYQYIKNIINEEVEKTKQNKKITSSNKLMKEFIFSTVFPSFTILKQLGVNKEQLKKIVEFLDKDYELGEEYKKIINNSIESK